MFYSVCKYTRLGLTASKAWSTQCHTTWLAIHFGGYGINRKCFHWLGCFLAEDPRQTVGCFLLVFNQECTRGKGNKEPFNEVLLPWYCWSTSSLGQEWMKVIFVFLIFFWLGFWEIKMLLTVRFSWEMCPPKNCTSSQGFVEVFCVKTPKTHCTKSELPVDLQNSLCKLMHMERETCSDVDSSVPALKIVRTNRS